MKHRPILKKKIILLLTYEDGFTHEEQYSTMVPTQKT